METTESIADVLVRHTRQHIDQMNAAVFAADQGGDDRVRLAAANTGCSPKS